LLSAAAAGAVLTAWRRAARRLASTGDRLSRLLDPARRRGADGPSVDEQFDRLDRTTTDLSASLDDRTKELAKAAANLQGVLDGLGEPVVATGEQETILLCNRAAEAMIGVPPGGLAGLRFREVFTRPELVAMHASARAGKAASQRVRLTTPEGVRTFEVTASPLPAAWGRGIYGAVVFMRDVTALAQAVQMRTDFVANASHELRTPVAAIRSAAETLLDGAKDDPPVRDRLLSMITVHAQRLEELTTDLMDLSRLESPEMPVNPTVIAMDDVAETIRTAFEQVCGERRLTLRFDVDPGAAEFETDPKLLSLILRNLVDNATKYAFEGTEVVVKAAPTEPASVGGSVVTIRVEVIDRGQGIPLALQERVFERFYQVDAARTGPASRRGTGLGLAIVKHAAKALGGRVGLESAWGEGTRVWVEIPVTIPAPRTDDGAGPAAPGDHLA
ncbi:MAG: PAS domain-containing protein, partial [Phycisphaerae bacterium]|nr:PAS domain-containing protein [Phycisphaerae bacterium]